MKSPAFQGHDYAYRPPTEPTEMDRTGEFPIFSEREASYAEETYASENDVAQRTLLLPTAVRGKFVSARNPVPPPAATVETLTAPAIQLAPALELAPALAPALELELVAKVAPSTPPPPAPKTVLTRAVVEPPVPVALYVVSAVVVAIAAVALASTIALHTLHDGRTYVPDHKISVSAPLEVSDASDRIERPWRTASLRAKRARTQTYRYSWDSARPQRPEAEGSKMSDLFRDDDRSLGGMREANGSLAD